MAKELSNRIREIIHKAIDGNQSALVKDRNIMDCILIANEAVDDYRRTKKRGILIILDLEKAYDYTDWDFLDYCYGT